MTCDRTLAYAIPDATAQAAQPALPNGNLYLTMPDGIGPIFTIPDFVDLYHARPRPAEAAARLAVVLVMIEIEQLSDAQAAEAVPARIDWKYALALQVDDPGFAASILPDFRSRLLVHGAEERLLTLLLDTLVDAGLLKARTRQRSDSTPVLATIGSLTRLRLLAETMRHALTDLGSAAPHWLPTQIAPAWTERYAVRVEVERLAKEPSARQLLVQAIGQEGFQVLRALHAPTTPPDLQLRPAVRTLRAVWHQH